MYKNISKTTVVSISGIIVLAAVIITYQYIRSANGLPYDFAVVKRGNLVHEVTPTGVINPVVSVQVGSQVSGTIKELYVDYNSPVKKGQLIALIDPAAFKAQLEQAEANLNAARANRSQREAGLLYSKALMEKAEAQYKEEELNYTRVKNLFPEGYVSKSQFDASEAAFDTAAAQRRAQEAQYRADSEALNAARAQVAQLEGAVNFARVNLEYTNITSPINGVVISRNVDVGQTVAATLQAPTLFVIAEDLTKMQVKSNVSEADIGDMRVGQGVTFTVDAYPDRVFKGTVKEVRMSPDVVQNVVTYGVITWVDNIDLLLRPGMTADVRIKTARKENVLMLPAAAVKEKEGKKHVEVLEGKEVRKKEVTTGMRSSDGFIEITSGLKEGEKAVVAVKHD